MSDRISILVTGASGFIGSSLTNYLLEQGHELKAVGRSKPTTPLRFLHGELSDAALLSRALQGVDCVVHLAGRAHQLRDEARDPLASFRAVNLDLSVGLARQAAMSGVRRFVFMSSIGVNGAATGIDPFVEDAVPAPHSDYAQSKLEAEQALQMVAAEYGMELTIIRPPLVYAGHAPGNFARLLRIVAMGMPLPFGGLDNQRSMIALDNLIELIATCVVHPAAAGELFLAADGDDLSTGDLVHILAEGMGRQARLFPMPARLLSIGATLVGKRAIYTQLCESLRVDASKARRLLGWQPRKSARQALLEAGSEYSRHCGR
ncbi:NAD-dependent epimerase/dehydratase family protein [Pseudomonas sp. LA21]|uniref:NAD-dependent epimerase/dehydratase family protein n=1 Tax=unclassified Pseudomonas TaxID=196821 RepID=UPI001FB7CB7A|nr:NAD-dependent epimerase/dehydratase family protein [Pseudomonas sp. LA21]